MITNIKHNLCFFLLRNISNRSLYRLSVFNLLIKSEIESLAYIVLVVIFIEPFNTNYFNTTHALYFGKTNLF